MSKETDVKKAKPQQREPELSGVFFVKAGTSPARDAASWYYERAREEHFHGNGDFYHTSGVGL